MRYWGLDVLACIYCKQFPLRIHVLNTIVEELRVEDIPIPYCKTYCGYLNTQVTEGREYPCRECLKIEVSEAVLYCINCKHWYPVKNGIVIMMPDNRRRPEADIEFLKKYADKLPNEIVYEGLPHNLSREVNQRRTHK
ncbi:MAG: Trm112 family protein [Desulfurococcaceae archaeon]